MSAEPRVVASGLRFPEGPVYLGDGAVLVTEIRGGCVTRCADGSTTGVANTGGGPNGAATDADGAVWVANNGGLSLGPDGYWFASDFGDGTIQRVGTDGGVRTVFAAEGAAPHRPNDICFGPDGRLYFTDPRNWEDFANLQTGRVWRLDPASGGASVIAEVPQFPNGIGFGPDGLLYVAQSNLMKILTIDHTGGGAAGVPSEFATLPRGFPDGFCFSSQGDLYVCGSLGDVIQVYDAEGTLKETIEFPEHSEPTNACIGDGVLYVTCSGSGELVAFDRGIEPLPLYPFRR